MLKQWINFKTFTFLGKTLAPHSLLFFENLRYNKNLLVFCNIVLSSYCLLISHSSDGLFSRMKKKLNNSKRSIIRFDRSRNFYSTIIHYFFSSDAHENWLDLASLI